LDNQVSEQEAKYNLFDFHRHLLQWINVSAQHFYRRDYPSAVEAITNVYTDTYEFCGLDKKKLLSDLFDVLVNANNEYVQYNSYYQERIKKIKNQSYAPPMKVYNAYIKFRIELMSELTKRGLTMKMKQKGIAGAADVD